MFTIICSCQVIFKFSWGKTYPRSGTQDSIVPIIITTPQQQNAIFSFFCSTKELDFWQDEFPRLILWLTNNIKNSSLNFFMFGRMLLDSLCKAVTIKKEDTHITNKHVSCGNTANKKGQYFHLKGFRKEFSSFSSYLLPNFKKGSLLCRV